MAFYHLLPTYSLCLSSCFDFYYPILSYISYSMLFYFNLSLILFYSLFKTLLNFPPFPQRRGLAPPLQTPRCKGLSSSPTCCYIHTSHTYVLHTYIRALSIVPKWAARSALQGSACLPACCLPLPVIAIYCLLVATGSMLAAVNPQFEASPGLCPLQVAALLMPSPRKACFWPRSPLASFCPLFAR